MIFVSLGTNDKEFVRLLKEIENQKKIGNIKEDIFVQAGCTVFSSNYMTVVDLMDMDEFNEKIKNCSMLITHGGVGTILDGLRYDKPIIAFPRLSKYGEHVNDHQIEIINEFKDCGYLLSGDVENLNKLYNQAKNFVPKKYKSNNYRFNKFISDYIDNI